jgi:RHS repeat-associated protein
MGCTKLHIIEEEFLQECGSSIPLKHNIVIKENGLKHCISDDIGCGECYRFLFNGMESDPEMKGTGNCLDFGARIYDPRIGRWLSVDPLIREYPSWSPYNSFLSNPIYIIDPDGKGGKVSKVRDINTGKVAGIKVSATIYVYSDQAQVVANLHDYAGLMKDEIECNWNIMAVKNEDGSISYEKPTDKWAANGQNYTVEFSVNVIPVTLEEASKIAASNKDKSVNFIRLYEGGSDFSGSQVNGNSGFIDVKAIRDGTHGSKTYAHEFGHLMEYFNPEPDAAQSTHYGVYSNEDDLPDPFPMMATAADEPERFVTKTDVTRLNSNKGLVNFPKFFGRKTRGFTFGNKRNEVYKDSKDQANKHEKWDEE